MLQNNKVLEMI